MVNLNKPKVSVVVTVYNKQNYVGVMVNSLVKQTYKNLEIILVNDGSTDNSLEVCNQLAKEDDRIVVYSQENKGVSAARNLGISKATGEFVMSVDADDEMLFDGISNMVGNFTDEVDCVIAGFQQIKNGKTIDVFPKRKVVGSIKDESVFEAVAEYSLNGDVTGTIRMYRRSKLQYKYNENCNYWENMDFAIHNLQYFNKVVMLPIVVYKYTPIPNKDESLSAKSKPEAFDKLKALYPEVTAVAKSMFPNSSKLIYLTGAFLLVGVVVEAKYLTEQNIAKEVVDAQIAERLSDDMVQELVSYAKDSGEFSDVVEMVETKNTEAFIQKYNNIDATATSIMQGIGIELLY